MAVIFGLSFATVLTLLMVPTLLAGLEGLRLQLLGPARAAPQAIGAAIPLLQMRQGHHVVEVRLSRLTPETLTALEAAGLIVTSASPRYGVATGLVGSEQLEALAAELAVTAVLAKQALPVDDRQLDFAIAR